MKMRRTKRFTYPLMLVCVLGLVACALPTAAPPGVALDLFTSSPTLLHTQTTPHQTATAAALIIQQALAMTATLTIQPTTTATTLPTSSPTSTPNLAATQTTEAEQLATAVVGTLTAQPTPTHTATPTPDQAATQVAVATHLAVSVAATLTALPTPSPVAQVYGFMACLEPCNSNPANARRSFPAGVKKIHLEWQFAGIPTDARYTRSWILQGMGEWVRYQCTWPGPTTGMDAVTLSEPGGLHSGVWEVSITVNEEVLMREQLVVEEEWDYWFWAGIFDSCYGKRQ